MATVGATVPQPSSSGTFPIPVEPRTRRLESIDLLRGLLMIFMALDHTRDFFSVQTVNPTDPQHSWAALFLTRWVTHLCAPGFIALAGASVYLQRQRGKTPAQLSRLLFTRGLWLLFLEVTVISFGWSFTIAPFLQVIWAISWSMIALSALMRLPTLAIGATGVFGSAPDSSPRAPLPAGATRFRSSGSSGSLSSWCSTFLASGSVASRHAGATGG